MGDAKGAWETPLGFRDALARQGESTSTILQSFLWFECSNANRERSIELEKLTRDLRASLNAWSLTRGTVAPMVTFIALILTAGVWNAGLLEAKRTRGIQTSAHRAQNKTTPCKIFRQDGSFLPTYLKCLRRESGAKGGGSRWESGIV